MATRASARPRDAVRRRSKPPEKNRSVGAYLNSPEYRKKWWCPEPDWRTVWNRRHYPDAHSNYYLLIDAVSDQATERVWLDYLEWLKK